MPYVLKDDAGKYFGMELLCGEQKTWDWLDDINKSVLYFNKEDEFRSTFPQDKNYKIVQVEVFVFEDEE